MAIVKLKGKVKLKANITDIKLPIRKPKHAIITIGMPNSGKTAWASQQQEYTSIDTSKLYSDKKQIELRDAFIKRAADKQQNIIINDTNIDPSARQKLASNLKAAGYSVEYKLFDITLEEALKRNASSKVKVSEDSLVKMYNWLKEQNINGSSSK